MSGNQQKHFDVARPGASTPQHTSRPIIVGRSPVARDPMVKPDNEEAPQPSAETPQQRMLSGHQETVISPPPSSSDTQSGDLTRPKSEPQEDTESLDSADAPSTQVIDDNLPASPVKDSDKVADKAKELIANKQYDLPIKRPASSTGKIAAITMVTIIAIAASIYVALVATNTI